MATDTAAASEADHGEVMAAIEGTPERLVIADVTRDDAWLAMALEDTVAVSERV
ncbi:MAG: hypothetical protein ABEJ23_10645 [Haloarculaceae archaeon]